MHASRLAGTHFLLTVDVEDWFQVENLRAQCPPSTWDQFDLRVERSTHRLLDLLDSVPKLPARHVPSGTTPHHTPAACAISPAASCPAPETSSFRPHPEPSGSNRQPATSVSATFFILGWVAERVPALVREIAARGHEIASHGQSHEMCTQLEEERIRQDLDRSRKLLEDLMGAAVRGYRAPSFSVSPKVLEIAREAGYVYDSSYNSFSGHGRYGQIDLSRSQKTGRAYRIGSGFYELPVSNLRIAGKVIPLGGGGYFRLIPWPAFRSGIRRILAQEGAYMFYCHPWEIDPEQPRVLQNWSRAGFKHYVNLGDTEKRIRRMLHAFAGCDFVSCSQYLRHAVEGEGGRAPGGSALTGGSACSRA